MGVTIQATFPGDGSATDLTPYYRDGTLQIQQVICDGYFHPSVDSCSFQLIHNDTITTKFLTASDIILVTISGDQTFTGVAEPSFSQDIHEIVDHIDIDCRDNSYLLEEYNSSAFSYPATVGGTPYKIFDPSDTANSIVHQLLQMAGYNIATDIDPAAPAITTTLTHISRENEEETYWDIISVLLWEYGYTFYFTTGGRFSIFQWIKDSLTAAHTFNGDNVLSCIPLQRQKEFITNKGSEVEWHTLRTKTDALLYREPVDFDEKGFPAGMPVLDDLYYPAGGNDKDIFQEYVANWLEAPVRIKVLPPNLFRGRSRQRPGSSSGSAPTGKNAPPGEKDITLVATSNHRIDDDYDPGFTRTETFYSKRAKVLYHNESGATADLYYFDIYGDALYRHMRNYAQSKITGHSSSTQLFRYQAQNIFDSAAANKLAVALKDTIQYGDFTYSFASRDKVDPGTIAQLVSDPDINTTVVITARYTEVMPAVEQPYYEYEAVGITEYTSEIVVSYGSQTQSPQTQEEATDSQLNNRPTYEEIDDGYDVTGGGTTTPTDPILQGFPFVNTVVLYWDNQNLLRWLDKYEVQVSIDNTNWYSLEFDGSDWKDALNMSTDTTRESLSHTNIPTLYRSVTGDLTLDSKVVTDTDTTDLTEGETVGGTGVPADTVIDSIDSATQITMSNPATSTQNNVILNFTENRYHNTYYYRVRRVSTSGGNSDWSNVVTVTPKLVGGTDIGVESISAVHIEAGSITSAKISTGVLNALVAQINNSLEISDSYGWLAGTYDSPGSGDTRAYLDPNEVVLQEHNGSAWVDKIRLGSVDVAGDYKASLVGPVKIIGEADGVLQLARGSGNVSIKPYGSESWVIIDGNTDVGLNYYSGGNVHLCRVGGYVGIGGPPDYPLTIHNPAGTGYFDVTYLDDIYSVLHLHDNNRYLIAYHSTYASLPSGLALKNVAGGDIGLYLGSGGSADLHFLFRDTTTTIGADATRSNIIANAWFYMDDGTDALGFDSNEIVTSGNLVITAGGYFSFRPNNTRELELSAAALYPYTDKGLTLGAPGNAWKDLYVGEQIYATGVIDSATALVCDRPSNPGNTVGSICVNSASPNWDLIHWYTNSSSRWAYPTNNTLTTW